MSNPPSCPECARLRDKIAALREDRNEWRAITVMLFRVVRSLRDFVLER